jgi:hypothetical protein
MDLQSKAKNNVLEELIKLMEERELGELKGKSPKFAKVDIKSDDPEMVDELKEKLMGDCEEEPMEFSKDKFNKEDPKEDDDLERLKELYSKLK